MGQPLGATREAPQVGFRFWGWGFTAEALAVVLAWELLKSFIRAALASKPKRLCATGPSNAELAKELAGLRVPPEPHMELALDPPTGIHFSNPEEVYPFETQFAEGSCLFFHVPKGPDTAVGPGGMDYGAYFRGKARLWELRIHVRFKRPPLPGEDIFFGVELEDYVPLNMATARAQKLIVAGIRQSISGVYHSAGDDPETTRGECERPCCMLPLWAFDQFIETPAEQEPPSLADPAFPTLGKRRYTRIREYAREIDDLQKHFQVGPTYTLAFWGISRFLDVLNWTIIGIPVATPIDFDKLAGKPPVFFGFYSLTPPVAGDADAPKGEQAEQRHLQSRKCYYLRLALWSSGRRPTRSRLLDLTGMEHVMQEDDNDAPRTQSRLRNYSMGLIRRIGSGLGEGMSVCTSRCAYSFH